WLACDADAAVWQVRRGDAIAGKPAPTGSRARPSLAKRPLSYSKTATRGRRLVHCASFYTAVTG
ncbi:hypothetical protein F0169_27255, partial [Pseudomonas sp. MAFF 212408]|nr:hypothetical protein [Pseudomonas kitaguniensis]